MGLGLNIGSVRQIAMALIMLPQRLIVVGDRPPNLAADNHLLRVITRDALRSLVGNYFGRGLEHHGGGIPRTSIGLVVADIAADGVID